MPTPLGHSLAGVAVYAAFTGRLLPRRRREGELLALTVVAACLPDLDFLHLGPDGWPTVSSLYHHAYTHSLGFALAMAAGAGLWGWGRRYAEAGRTALMVGVAVGSHILLDLLGVDTYLANGVGLPVFWPVSDHYYLVPLTPGVDRGDLFRPANFLVAGGELAIGSALIALALRCRRSGQASGNGTGDRGADQVK